MDSAHILGLLIGVAFCLTLVATVSAVNWWRGCWYGTCGHCRGCRPLVHGARRHHG